jgi:hypothetical protein
LVTLCFRGAQKLTIRRAFLDEALKLAALIQFDPTPVINLQHMSLPSGHILANYLCTGAYEPLEGPATGNAEITAKLKQALETYSTAHRYRLDDLEELAKAEVADLSTYLQDPMAVISIVHEVCPTVPADDEWFPVYLKA